MNGSGLGFNLAGRWIGEATLDEIERADKFRDKAGGGAVIDFVWCADLIGVAAMSVVE